MVEPLPSLTAPSLPITDAEFAQFQGLLRDITGIHLTEFKKTLLVARLTSRLRARRVQTFTEYFKLIRDPREGEELQAAINHLTTNETFFFREPEHFKILKDFIASLRPVPAPFRVWSAASSSGEEAYSIAMVAGGRAGRFPLGSGGQRHQHPGSGAGPGRALPPGAQRRHPRRLPAPVLPEGPGRPGRHAPDRQAAAGTGAVPPRQPERADPRSGPLRCDLPAQHPHLFPE